jgi:type I restriction enzyme M protein
MTRSGISRLIEAPMSTQDIVQKLWNLCNVLRDDGITYHQYVTELTYLLFLKMAKETGTEEQLPKGYRWSDLESKDGVEQLNFYRGAAPAPGHRGLGAGAGDLRQRLDLPQGARAPPSWSTRSTRSTGTRPDEGLGDLYEGLLEKNASEKKSGAGQYFTPRPLIDAMVRLIKPQAGELVQDPAAGTCGFLIAADRYVKARPTTSSRCRSEADLPAQKAFYGVELVHDTHRLALMNLMLHDIEGDLLLATRSRPPGTEPAEGRRDPDQPALRHQEGRRLPTRDDFTFPTSNKQLAFLQHIYRGLKPGGRAAVVLPDNVLFEDNVGAQIRADLMDKCDLHTILRLPTGHLLRPGREDQRAVLHPRREGHDGNTKAVWIYDMRTNAPAFGKRTQLTREHFEEFEKAFGDDPLGKSKRKDSGETGALAEVHARGDREARRQPRHQLAEFRCRQISAP